MAKAPTPAPASAPSRPAASAPPPVAELSAQPEGFAAPETPAPEPEKVSPFLWMLRVDQGVRGLGGDLVRRWSSKPLTAADADNPNAAAKSVGARAENELRVAAGVYRPHVPPGALAAYDRSTDEVAEAVNKQTSDAFRARAQAALEDGARATFEATSEHLVAAHDQAVRDGDHPRAETLAAQIADLDRFRGTYLRAAPADTAVKTAAPADMTASPAPAKPEESPARLEAPPAPSEAPVPASIEPVKTDPPPPAAPPALTSPEAEEQRRLETRIDQDAATLSRDFDPQSKEGEVSWKKRVYVLLHYVDHPAFDAIAAELGLDPARARLVAALLTAGPADRERLIRRVMDEIYDLNGNLRDPAFATLYLRALGDVLKAVADPNVSPAQAADIRSGAVLDLLSKQGIGKDYAEVIKQIPPGAPVAHIVAKAIEERFGDSLPPELVILAAMVGARRRGAGQPPSAMAAGPGGAHGPDSKRLDTANRAAYDRLGDVKGQYRFFHDKTDLTVNGVRIHAAKGAVVSNDVLAGGTPMGFRSAEEFRGSMLALRAAIPEKYGTAKVGMRGSALHGRSVVRREDSKGERNHTAKPFDSGGPGTSDLDVFVINKRLYNEIAARGLADKPLSIEWLAKNGHPALAGNLKAISQAASPPNMKQSRAATVRVFSSETDLRNQSTGGSAYMIVER
jgi:hypothetical protein